VLTINSIGWHQSMVVYRNLIRDIIEKMFLILPKIRLENRSPVNNYLALVDRLVTSLQTSLGAWDIDEHLQERFTSYIKAEEARLKRNLEDVHYNIDAMNTLVLITGPGRIERVCILFFISRSVLTPLT